MRNIDCDQFLYTLYPEYKKQTRKEYLNYLIRIHTDNILSFYNGVKSMILDNNASYDISAMMCTSKPLDIGKLHNSKNRDKYIHTVTMGVLKALHQAAFKEPLPKETLKILDENMLVIINSSGILDDEIKNPLLRLDYANPLKVRLEINAIIDYVIDVCKEFNKQYTKMDIKALEEHIRGYIFENPLLGIKEITQPLTEHIISLIFNHTLYDVFMYGYNLDAGIGTDFPNLSELGKEKTLKIIQHPTKYFTTYEEDGETKHTLMLVYQRDGETPALVQPHIYFFHRLGVAFRRFFHFLRNNEDLFPLDFYIRDALAINASSLAGIDADDVQVSLHSFNNLCLYIERVMRKIDPEFKINFQSSEEELRKLHQSHFKDKSFFNFLTTEIKHNKAFLKIHKDKTVYDFYFNTSRKSFNETMKELYYDNGDKVPEEEKEYFYQVYLYALRYTMLLTGRKKLYNKIEKTLEKERK